MRKIFSSITLVLFFIWILPLGVFIKPSAEKLACGGQRLICLCSKMTDKTQQKTSAKISFQNSTGVHKEEGSSGGASHYFLISHLNNQRATTLSNLTDQVFLTDQNSFLKAIEHVPKIASS